MKTILLFLSLFLYLEFLTVAQSRKSPRRNLENAKIACNVCPNPLITDDEIIYVDTMNVNWQIFPTTISLNISNSNTQFINYRSIKIVNPTENQLLDLRYNTIPLNTIDYPDGFEFWIYNESSTPYPLTIQVFTTSSSTNNTTSSNVATPNKWTHFLLDWSAFGNPQTVGRITVKLNRTIAESLYFDQIKLVHCADMYSTKTGNWNDQTLWSCGRLPILTDIVTIDPQHTVTVLNGVSATLSFLKLFGTLDIKSGGIINMKNY